MPADGDAPIRFPASPIAQGLRQVAEGRRSHDRGVADLMALAADEIDRLRGALAWCSGAPGLAPGGEAHEAWLEICGPLLA